MVAKKHPYRLSKLLTYFYLTYIALLINSSAYLRHMEFHSAVSVFFNITVFLSYTFCYLLMGFLPALLLLNILVPRGPIKRFFDFIHVPVRYVVYGVAILTTSFLQVFIYADHFIYNLYDYHINGFIWNVITTRGGLESMGSSSSTVWSFGLIIAGLVALQTALMIITLRSQWFIDHIRLVFRPRRVRIGITACILLSLSFQGVAYGACDIAGYGPVLVSAPAFPFYLPVTFKHLAEKWGYEIKRDPLERVYVKKESLRLNYPLQPIRMAENRPRYNIVWLVAETWRADMLSAEIMPATWAFAENSVRFTHHYSGGNGTRMGMFSMFYGLYGNYWFSMLPEMRSPVLMDVLLDDNYQMKMFTSAKFSYPEFDRTIFARIPSENLTEGKKGMFGWENDRQNVSQLLDFIDHRDSGRPFMAFMFFESPHANYYFPPESVIRENYLKDFNYASMNLKEDMPGIFNRYVNSCHHLDSQFQRVFDYLSEHHLLDSTIVVATGDHGEEFMEKGHWGHNSTFVDEQTRTPLVLHFPGKPAEVYTGLSSHLDIPPMVLSQLGVMNPPGEYCLGYDLIDGQPRTFSVIASWDSLCYVNQDFKMNIPMKLYRLKKQQLTLPDDTLLVDESAFLETHQAEILQTIKIMMSDTRLFKY
ncbi:MAG: sulfatase-like hydrolase/transferase [Sedimentisphaerales bacterium]|nr:sulfatase-like hydrolase/transferase [Sedimentisphaerales bacterium]